MSVENPLVFKRRPGDPKAVIQQLDPVEMVEPLTEEKPHEHDEAKILELELNNDDPEAFATDEPVPPKGCIAVKTDYRAEVYDGKIYEFCRCPKPEPNLEHVGKIPRPICLRCHGAIDDGEPVEPGYTIYRIDGRWYDEFGNVIRKSEL